MTEVLIPCRIKNRETTGVVITQSWPFRIKNKLNFTNKIVSVRIDEIPKLVASVPALKNPVLLRDGIRKVIAFIKEDELNKSGA